MVERMFELYKSSVYLKIKEFDRDAIPASWWDTLIRHYFKMGYTDERAALSVLETVKG